MFRQIEINCIKIYAKIEGLRYILHKFQLTNRITIVIITIVIRITIVIYRCYITNPNYLAE